MLPFPVSAGMAGGQFGVGSLPALNMLSSSGLGLSSNFTPSQVLLGQVSPGLLPPPPPQQQNTNTSHSTLSPELLAQVLGQANSSKQQAQQTALDTAGQWTQGTSHGTLPDTSSGGARSNNQYASR